MSHSLKFRKPLARQFSCASTLLLCSVFLIGQSQTGEVRIEVKDASGAVMQAGGRLENPATGLVQSFQTDARVFTPSGT